MDRDPGIATVAECHDELQGVQGTKQDVEEPTSKRTLEEKQIVEHCGCHFMPSNASHVRMLRYCDTLSPHYQVEQSFKIYSLGIEGIP